MPDVYQLSVTPVLRYSILAGIMGLWCKAISDWFIDLWPGSVLIHINVMTLQSGCPAHLQILIVFIKKLWENVGQNMTTKEYWIFVFPHNGLHFINQGNVRREKKDLRRRGMTSMKLNSNIPNNQDANTINNVTFFVLGVTVITITGWPGILTLSSGSIKNPVWSSLVNL